MEASQEVKLLSFIVETMFRRIDLSFVKLGQWSNDKLFQPPIRNCRLG